MVTLKAPIWIDRKKRGGLTHCVGSTKSALNRWLSQHKSGQVEKGGRLKIVHEELDESRHEGLNGVGG